MKSALNLLVINFFLQAVISNMKVTCKYPVRC
jgi:hypothetical protein